MSPPIDVSQRPTTACVWQRLPATGVGGQARYRYASALGGGDAQRDQNQCERERQRLGRHRASRVPKLRGPVCGERTITKLSERTNRARIISICPLHNIVGKVTWLKVR